MMHYLVYNFKRDVKIATGRTVGTTIYTSEYHGDRMTSFRVDQSKKYFTQVPLERMKLVNGKIWCDDTDDIAECIKQVSNYICELNMRDNESKLLILRPNIVVHNDRLAADYRNILEQRRNGVIILPNYLDILYISDSNDVEIKFEEEDE